MSLVRQKNDNEERETDMRLTYITDGKQTTTHKTGCSHLETLSLTAENSVEFDASSKVDAVNVIEWAEKYDRVTHKFADCVPTDF